MILGNICDSLGLYFLQERFVKIVLRLLNSVLRFSENCCLSTLKSFGVHLSAKISSSSLDATSKLDEKEDIRPHDHNFWCACLFVEMVWMLLCLWGCFKFDSLVFAVLQVNLNSSKLLYVDRISFCFFRFLNLVRVLGLGGLHEYLSRISSSSKPEDSGLLFPILERINFFWSFSMINCLNL